MAPDKESLAGRDRNLKSDHRLEVARTGPEAQQAIDTARCESQERGRKWAATNPSLLEELHQYHRQRQHAELETQRVGAENLRAFAKRYVHGGIASQAFIDGALEQYRG